MESAGTTIFRDTYFEHPELTKIHGEPTFEILQTVENELKANDQSVYSSLGGGQHGHLGLVVSPLNIRESQMYHSIHQMHQHHLL